MKRYLFLTSQGSMYSPGGEDLPNLQALGFGDGTTPAEAAADFQANYPWLGRQGITEVEAIEVRPDHDWGEYLELTWPPDDDDDTEDECANFAQKG